MVEHIPIVDPYGPQVYDGPLPIVFSVFFNLIQFSQNLLTQVNRAITSCLTYLEQILRLFTVGRTVVGVQWAHGHPLRPGVYPAGLHLERERGDQLGGNGGGAVAREEHHEHAGEAH